MLSQRVQRISLSPTLRISARAQRMRAEGVDVVDLSAGEPDFPTPEPVVRAAKAALDAGFTKYVANDGILELRQAICERIARDSEVLWRPENVLVSPGAKAALYSLLLTILDPQDEVIIPAPYWVSYPEMVKMAYGKPVIVTPEDGRFEPRMKDIEAAVTSYTKAIIINSPNNPSGAVYSSELIQQVVEFCERKNLYLIMDDIYHKLVFDRRHAPSAYQFAHAPFETGKLIVINGLSKLYGMTGFRIGWTIAPKQIIEVMNNVQAQSVSCPSSLLQAAAVGALTGMQTVVDALNMQPENHRNVMMKELDSFEGVHITRPAGTFYCLPDFSHYGRDSGALAAFLLEKALVVTVPGKEFGMDGHLRLSYCGSLKEIMEGVQRIKWALDPNAPKEIYIGDRKLVRDWK
jgi:aspartate aminotransferase